MLMTLALSATAIGAQREPLLGLRLIVVKTEAEATGLRARLIAGESFEELAKNYSTDSSAAGGGYLGPVAVGDLRPEIQEALAGLAPEARAPRGDRTANGLGNRLRGDRCQSCPVDYRLRLRSNRIDQQPSIGSFR